ncbi:MAG: EAL domain-containing protein [Mycobacteriales bacterium]
MGIASTEDERALDERQHLLVAMATSASLPSGLTTLLEHIAIEAGFAAARVWTLEEDGLLGCAGNWSLQHTDAGPTPGRLGRLRTDGTSTLDLAWTASMTPFTVVEQRDRLPPLAPAPESAGWIVGRTVVVPIADAEGTLALAEFVDSADSPVDDDYLRHVLGDVGFVAPVLRQLVSIDALRESETLFRTITRFAPDAIISCDGNNVIRFWNRGAESVFGYTEEEALGQAVGMLLPEWDAQAPYLLRAFAVTSNKRRLSTQTVEMDGRSPDGRTLSIELSLASWQTREGPRTTLIARDISQRKAVEKQLRSSEVRFRSAFDNAPIGLMMVDLRQAHQGVLLKVNRALCVMSGFSPEELIGIEFQRLIHPDDFETATVAMAQFTDNGGSQQRFQMELRLVRRDEGVRWTALSVSAITDDEGKPSYALAHVQDITERKESEAKLTQMALHDTLTGLANRALLMEQLDQALFRSTRQGGKVAVLFIDLDRFKVINDSLGHDAGDELLVTVAERLNSCLRGSDVAARLGGDEFVVVCENVADSDEALIVAHRLEQAIGSPTVIKGVATTVTASIGVVMAGAGASADSLLRDADAAMYKAKDGGRGRFELYDASIGKVATKRLQTENEIRRALDEGEFVLHYQPIVDLSNNGMVGVEALVRWQHPDRGLLAPGDFLSIAEETGLIVPLGTWVLNEACRQLAQWQHDVQTAHDLSVSVNLAAAQVSCRDLVDVVEDALARSGIAPSELCLEITESVLLDATSDSTSRLIGVKGLGVRLALDDFGTGYSSLTYLRRFPVDVVKIDRTFVSGLGTDPADDAIVDSVVGLAQSLGLAAVAEGVETREQAEALQAMGCRFAQGYLYAKALPAEDLREILRGTTRLGTHGERTMSRGRIAWPTSRRMPGR